MRLLREYGWAERYVSQVAGWNTRLDEIQAAILRVKLRHLDEWNEERARRAAAYSAALEGAPGVVVPREKEGARSAWHLYTIRAPERDALAEHLKARGIGTAIHYPRPIHLQASMASAGGRPGELPVSEQLSREVLCLPLYPELPLEDVERVAAEVRAFASGRLGRG